MAYRAGRHFLQIPGPTNVPDRILRAIERPTMDHRSSEFSELGRECLKGLQMVFKTENPVIIYPSSATGAWEAALVNTLNVGDRVLAFETGQFASLWAKMAANLGLCIDMVPGDWRHGVNPAQLEEKLVADVAHKVKAVLVVHNETSTGVTTNIPAIRSTIDRVKHPALLLVDTVSSLGSIEYRHDEWRVDVTIAGSQKGMMLPPGLAFNAIGPRAIEASRTSNLLKSYWRWSEMLDNSSSGFLPYTPATNLLYGLREANIMLQEEGLANVFARHARLAEATRCAARGWGLEIVARRSDEFSNTLTALFVPEGFNERDLRRLILEKFNMSLGAGLGQLSGRAFRIGHLGDFNELMLMGTLAGVEMGLQIAGIPHTRNGVSAALQYLSEQAA